MNAKTKRLQRVTATIEAMPLGPGLLDAAFERFCTTGDLPDHDKLAVAVVGRVLAASAARQPAVNMQMGLDHLARLLDQIEAGELLPQREPLRETLLQEAIHDSDFVRSAARTALRYLVRQGKDVTDACMLDGVDEPRFGTVGLRVIGFPEVLVRPPYKVMARRLMARFAKLRERVDDLDDEWFVALAVADVAFRAAGELPQCALMRDAVAANVALLDLVQRCIEGGAKPTTDENAGVLDALLLAAQAGDIHASHVLLTRVGAPATNGDITSTPRVGPPVPELPVLIEQMRRHIALIGELGL